MKATEQQKLVKYIEKHTPEEAEKTLEEQFNASKTLFATKGNMQKVYKTILEENKYDPIQIKYVIDDLYNGSSARYGKKPEKHKSKNYNDYANFSQI